MEVIVVALIVGVIGPATMAYLQHRLRRSERAEDRADRERVEEKVAAVAATLTEATAATDAALVGIQEQGAEIHTLVNSNLTAARAGELAALRTAAVAMRRIPGDDERDRADLAQIEARITELEAEMASREDDVP